MTGPEIVTAAQMSRIAIDLGLFASSLQTFKDDIERIIANLRGHIDETFRHWFGPRADAALSAAGQYIDAVDEAPAAIEAQIAIVEAAARFADVIEEELRPVEHWLASTRELLASPETANGALAQDEDDARSAIAEISARWVYARNQWFESALEPGNNAWLRAPTALHRRCRAWRTCTERRTCCGSANSRCPQASRSRGSIRPATLRKRPRSISRRGARQRHGGPHRHGGDRIRRRRGR